MEPITLRRAGISLKAPNVVVCGKATGTLPPVLFKLLNLFGRSGTVRVPAACLAVWGVEAVKPTRLRWACSRLNAVLGEIGCPHTIAVAQGELKLY